ncbi:uncharacterized protein LOC134653577 [Cydia amplana]|uniref:uncharacterized protein LOC134653577 n=1 Tax=Cydia amplana TaxID=1869771 RepID=UPI002FE65BAA
MARVNAFLPSPDAYYAILQERADEAESQRHKRFLAVVLLQRMVRGYLIRKHIAWLSKKATIIQRAFRIYLARKTYMAALRRAVRQKHGRYYDKAATRIQALWRGHYSRHTKFCYRRYRRWLATVTERGERRAAEALEFGLISRADNLRILEEEARKWLAFVVFKLHHLLRTLSRAGVYSDPATTELTQFEKLLKSIHYKQYMKRLKLKYDEFVRKHRPNFSNKRLFPIIGDGAEYWYLSLPEMYELTSPVPKPPDYRHSQLHHGSIHKEPFLWRKVRPPTAFVDRGPFMPKSPVRSKMPVAPAPTPAEAGDAGPQKDPRFHLYVQHYTPQPKLMDYVDFHINLLTNRKSSIQHVNDE